MAVTPKDRGWLRRGRFRRAAAPCALVAAAMLGLALVPGRAAAADGTCRRAVVFTLPGVLWEDLERVRPPELLDAARRGAVGSMSLRVGAEPSYDSAYATLGAGNRVDARGFEGPRAFPGPFDDRGPLAEDVRVLDPTALDDVSRRGRYGARVGALASALGGTEVAAVGSPWAALAATDERGVVDLLATGRTVTEAAPGSPEGVRTRPAAIAGAARDALDRCASVIVEQGDVSRADLASGASGRRSEALDDALRRADALVGALRAELDPERDLMLLVTPVTPSWDGDMHLGVAIAEGPGFAPGSSLSSATTRHAGIVTLQDVAPTVLDHLGAARPGSMLGRPFSGGPARGDRVAAAIDLDRESVAMLRWQAPIIVGFVAAQVAAYLLSLLWLSRRRDGGGAYPIEAAMLAVIAFPVASYLANAVQAHDLGPAAFVALLVAIDAALTAAVWLVCRRTLDRVLVLGGVTVVVIAGDLLLGGGALQLNAVFGNYPTFGGRFAGLGNTAFTVLGATTLVTGALIVRRSRGSARALAAVAALFCAAVLVDGLPQLGADVGGVIALIPALGVCFALLAGRRLTWTSVGLGIALVILSLGAFLALDLAQPPEARTHLARLVESVRSGGWDVLVLTVMRKLGSSLGVFAVSPLSFLVPPLVVAAAYLLSRRAPVGERLARACPEVRSALIGILVLAVVGFAANDSGIVIPALALVFLVPVTFLAYLAPTR